MSKRERWIVYPLLFFSLMMGLKTSFPPLMLRARSVECRSLRVELINGRPASDLAAIFDVPLIGGHNDDGEPESNTGNSPEGPTRDNAGDTEQDNGDGEPTSDADADETNVEATESPSGTATP